MMESEDLDRVWDDRRSARERAYRLADEARAARSAREMWTLAEMALAAFGIVTVLLLGRGALWLWG